LNPATGVPFTSRLWAEMLPRGESTDPNIDVTNLLSTAGFASPINPGNPTTTSRHNAFAVPNPSLCAAILPKHCQWSRIAEFLFFNYSRKITSKEFPTLSMCNCDRNSAMLFTHRTFAPPSIIEISLIRQEVDRQRWTDSPLTQTSPLSQFSLL